jgi:ribosomal protein S18
MSREQFIEQEMKQNPEFFKAFPHLQEPMYTAINEDAIKS